MHVVFGSGGYTVSESWTLLRPRATGRFPLIIALHGAGGDQRFLYDPLDPNVTNFFQRIVDAGFIVLAPDNEDGIGAADGTHTWGNDGSTTTVDNAVAYARASLGVDTGRVGILGTSMGCITGLNYWRRFPAQVAGMVAVSGAVSLAYHASGNDNPVGKYQTEVYAAYTDAAGYAAAAPTHDPNVFVPAQPGAFEPLYLYHAVDDVVAPYSNAQAFAAATKAKLTSLLSGGHTTGVWDEIDTDEVVDRFRSMGVGS